VNGLLIESTSNKPL